MCLFKELIFLTPLLTQKFMLILVNFVSYDI